jgi:hypothetical protein
VFAGCIPPLNRVFVAKLLGSVDANDRLLLTQNFIDTVSDRHLQEGKEWFFDIAQHRAASRLRHCAIPKSTALRAPRPNFIGLVI